MLSGWHADFRGRCDKRLARKAVDAALKSPEDALELPAGDISAARHSLNNRKGELRLDPEAMARAARSSDLAKALFDAVTDDTLPKDGSVAAILRMVLESTYQPCRHDEAYDRILTQEMLIDLCRINGITIQTLLEINAKVDRLNRERNFAAAASVIEDAFERIEAQRARVIEAGLEQAILSRNAADAAR